MNLAKHIKELVTLNECIILPDFGGFETLYKPAKFDSETEQMMPPDKEVFFKPEYKVGGDVLIHHLQKKLNISESEAKGILTDYVEEIKSALAENKYFLVDEVGEFSVNAKGMLCFKAIKEENYLAESFGLESIDVEKPEYENKKQELKQKVLKIRPRNNTLTFVLVGIFIVFILLALTVFVSSKFNLYLFNIGSSEETNDLLIIGGEQKTDSTYSYVEHTIDEITNVKHALQFSSTSTIESNTISNYYILVAGSFKSFRNASEVQKKLSSEGFNVELVEAGGYYRVSIGRFTVKEEALLELSRLRTQINRSVWLLTVTN